MSATKDALALASAEFDVSAVEEGQTITVCIQCPYVRHRRITHSTQVKWRGKPVFIQHPDGRRDRAIEAVSLDELRDLETDALRGESAEWLVVMGICSPFRCVPIANAGDTAAGSAPAMPHYDRLGPHPQGSCPFKPEIPALADTGYANAVG